MLRAMGGGAIGARQRLQRLQQRGRGGASGRRKARLGRVAGTSPEASPYAVCLHCAHTKGM